MIETRFDRATYRSPPFNADLQTLDAAIERCLQDKLISGTFMGLAELLLWQNPASKQIVEQRGGDVSELTPEQRVLASLFELDLDVQNGGLSQFFWNRPYWVPHIYSSLRAVDCNGLADLFRADVERVVAAFGSIAGYSEGNSLEAYSERASDICFEEFESAYYGSDKERYAKVIAYVRSHLDGFLLPGGADA